MLSGPSLPRIASAVVRLLVLPAALALTACSGPGLGPDTSALAPAAVPTKTAQAGAKGSTAPIDVAPLAAAHKAAPDDAAAALAYARALRLSGARAEAAAVLDKAVAAKPAERRLALESGLLALDMGQPTKAERLLRKAQDPKAEDWRLYSALGAALASRGKQQEAQVQFAKALALAPDHPTVLNNLAMSYVLDGKADEAEKLLRKAQQGAQKGAPPAAQVPQNLALVLGLRGKFDEAQKVATASLGPNEASSNVAYLQGLARAKTAAKDDESGSGMTGAKRTTASLPQPTYQLGGPSGN